MKKTNALAGKNLLEIRKVIHGIVVMMILTNVKILSQDPSKIYDETVKSCAIVTDSRQRGFGSGFFIGSNIFLTNYHVLKHLQEKSLTITKKTGEHISLKRVICKNSNSDIAVLETNESSGSFLKLARVQDIKTGDRVFAIGNPTTIDFKVYDFTFTEGIINNIAFEEADSPGFRISSNVILHSASLNPGNSGGPLLNSKGEVIGINAFAKGGAVNNMSFAIHLSEVLKELDENNVPYTIGLDSTGKYVTKNVDSASLKKSGEITKQDSALSDTSMLRLVSKKNDTDYFLLILFIIAAIGIPLIIISVKGKRSQFSGGKSPLLDSAQSERSGDLSNRDGVSGKVIPDAVLIVDGKRYRITEKGLCIGRDASCEIVLSDKNVSRQHLQILIDDNEFIIVDLNSKNGTYVNGVAIKRKQLQDRDIIKIGETTLVFVSK